VLRSAIYFFIHINNYFYAFYFGYNEMSNNTNCTLVFYFGVTILSLILLLVLAIAPQVQYNVFAQDEDEKEEEESEEEEQESNNEEEKEESEEEQQQQQEEDKTPVVEEEIVQPESNPTPMVLPEPILNFTQPVQNTAVETATPPIEEFNATCSCFTNNLSNPATPTPQPDAQTQIPISSANIVDSNSLGQVKDGNYTGYYTVSNLLDNKIDDTSFWSQAGNSGFTIQFDNTLNDYQVCSMELNNIHDPKGIPYFLDIGVSKNYTGVIDQVNEKIQFDKCVRDMNQIVLMFNKDNLESMDFISIGEIKLFGSKLGAVTPTTPPVLEPVQPTKPTTKQSTEYENATRINIQDSTAEIDIKNSTVTFKFDPMTATFVQQS
jgi:hypothetical protein